MKSCRSVLVLTLLFGALTIPETSANATSGTSSTVCTDSWKGAVSGAWGVSAYWSDGNIPAVTDAVCITVPGTYTVTLAPWSSGTADPNHNGATVRSLTLGTSSGVGTQTLDIAGQGSVSNSNEQLNTVDLNTAGASIVTAHGRLILDSTNGGTTLPKNPAGGFAAVSGAPFLNYGQILTEVQSLSNKYADFTQFEAPVTNEVDASVDDTSGLLQATAIINQGRFTVAPGASLQVLALQGVYGAPASFTNDGTLLNDGTITAPPGPGPVTWTQSGGSVTGHDVTLQGGAKLIDQAGAARFLMNSASATLTGTIPPGQRVTVEGEPFSSGGNNYNGTTLGLDGTTVTNDGTLVLDAQGSGKTTGGPALITDGTVRNNGTILAEVQDQTWSIGWQAGLTNNRQGTMTITGGTFDESGGGSASNDGTVTVGPHAVYLLQEGSTFTNKSDGRIVSQIAGTSSIGQFQMASPCCNGAGEVNAGGSLLPTLVGGYTPPANAEFQLFLLAGGKISGTFAHLGDRFTADYTHESTSPAFVGVVYRSTKK